MGHIDVLEVDSPDNWHQNVLAVGGHDKLDTVEHLIVLAVRDHVDVAAVVTYSSMKIFWNPL